MKVQVREIGIRKKKKPRINSIKYILIASVILFFIPLLYVELNFNQNDQENGELFKYISNSGKWYNLTYTSKTAPAYKNYEGAKIQNPNNFVEAYWFPKDYKNSVEDESLLISVLNNVKEDYQNTLDSSNDDIVNVNYNLKKYTISIIMYIILFAIMMIILRFLGNERIMRGLKESIVIKISQNFNNWFGSRTTSFKMVIFLLSSSSLLLMPLGLMLGFSIFSKLAIFYILSLLFYFIAIFPKIIKFSRYIDEITEGIAKITSGNLNHLIAEKGDVALSKLANNINKLNKGFKVSIEEQIKNEKLKSELVANVSHDLKTPLTSIINYTDILLRGNITEEEKIEYLNILNKKGIKLKNLIEDLFEISKINSGKVELNIESVDVIELAYQSIAEYSDSEIYNNKNLVFIVKPCATKIEMNLDGKKMSRVFENLINNALKYSLKDTRVFVEIEDIIKINDIKQGIKISFKNTSSTALDFHKEEIFERFTRGDKSRNSNIDGSGLGLAIAKSIIELHDGKMYVDFDGDMFKVIIELYY